MVKIFNKASTGQVWKELFSVQLCIIDIVNTYHTAQNLMQYCSLAQNNMVLKELAELVGIPYTVSLIYTWMHFEVFSQDHHKCTDLWTKYFMKYLSTEATEFLLILSVSTHENNCCLMRKASPSLLAYFFEKICSLQSLWMFMKCGLCTGLVLLLHKVLFYCTAQHRTRPNTKIWLSIVLDAVVVLYFIIFKISSLYTYKVTVLMSSTIIGLYETVSEIGIRTRMSCKSI